ncbi:hypothetical protein [Bacillus cereus group sp. BfR-BA-01400]|uniref:hypothetical protein n=1 Tax=Bacillus cereus group sp. BfR-BA-01400 TaxID=2920334 RepID=UPI001F573C11
MTAEIKKTKTTKEMAVSLKAELKNLSEWLIEIGELVGIDIQRDFNGEFDEMFIQEVCSCVQDQLAGDEYDIERQDKIIKAQEESIEALKEIVSNSNLIIMMLASQLATKYNDEIGKAYLEARK